MLRNRFVNAALVSAVFLIGASAGQAAEMSGPSASLQIINKAKLPLRWVGVGDLRSKTQLCIVSNTGRYRLQLVLAQSASQTLAPAYEIEFRTTSGDSIFRSSGQGNLYTFDGRTDGSESCNGAANASIEIRFSRDNLTAAVAGDYAEQFQISVIPN